MDCFIEDQSLLPGLLGRIGTGEPCCNGNRETWSLLLFDFRNSIPYFVWTGHGKFPERLQELERIFEAELGERLKWLG